jgi:thioredoxin-dependent peroxiredoxin
MLSKGDQIPNFKALNQEGEEITYENFKGKKLIIFFYPKASTPGCTLEVCNLRDFYEKLQEKGYQILGISADSIKKQKKFHQKYKLPFHLIADEDKKICEAFGVWGEKKIFRKNLFWN